MQSFTRIARQARPFALTRPAIQSRPFTRATCLRLKEDGDRSPEELDRIKHEQIGKQKKGEGHWHGELASSSETNVAADRENVDDHDKHMEDLQKETADHVEKNHPEGKKEH